ncbi:MAG: hypothetical protein ABSF90_03470 [Syntrophobacteraceae bacterium]|jgi:hypothetical protein
MCFGSAPSVPPPPPAPAPPPSLPDSGVQAAGQNQKNLAAAAYGASQTILTGPQGLQTPANTTGSGKTLLGG